MASSIPVPPACEECGGDPVFHEITYYSIVIDELMAPLFPSLTGGGLMSRISSGLERSVTPALFRLFIKLGIAKEIAEPDDATQLLALMIWNEAKERGIRVSEVRMFNLPRNLFLARLPGGRSISFEGIPLPPSEYRRVSWMDDKATLKEKFRKLGLPVARGGAAATLGAARRIYAKLTPPVIAKPFSGSGSATRPCTSTLTASLSAASESPSSSPREWSSRKSSWGRSIAPPLSTGASPRPSGATSRT